MGICQSLCRCFSKSHEIPVSSSSDSPPLPYQPLTVSTSGGQNPSFSKAPSSSQTGTILLKPYVDITSLYDLRKELGRGERFRYCSILPGSQILWSSKVLMKMPGICIW
ncbi:hypothetical protein V6Z11_A05G193800 [Gossypium hirsutum]